MNEQYLDSEVNEYIEIRNDKSDLESKWEMAIVDLCQVFRHKNL